MSAKTLPKLKVVFAEKCAWRAIYVYANEQKIAHLGVDPNNGVRPKAFGSVAGKEFRFTLPAIPWRYPSGPIYLQVYKLSSAFWHGVDGRYGWGTKKKQ